MMNPVTAWLTAKLFAILATVAIALQSTIDAVQMGTAKVDSLGRTYVPGLWKLLGALLPFLLPLWFRALSLVRSTVAATYAGTVVAGRRVGLLPDSRRRPAKPATSAPTPAVKNAAARL